MRLEGDEIGSGRVEQADGMTESEIDQVMRTIADPLVRMILTRRLSFTIGVFLTSSCQPDAEDLYQTVMLKAAAFLDGFKVKDRRPGLEELRGYLARITHNVCNDYLRQKYPGRTRLKDRVRDILKRHRDFDVWHVAGRLVCGFRSHRGQSESPRVKLLLNDLTERLGDINSDGLGLGQLASLELPKLLAELFRWVRGPIESDHLIQIISEIQGIKDRPDESIDDFSYTAHLQDNRSNDGFDRIASRQLLKKIWLILCGLTLNQRRTYLYIQTDYEGQSLLHLLIREQAVLLSEILEKLELTKEELIDLLGRVPMDPKLAAIELGTTNRMIAKWKYRAVKRVRAIIEE